MRGGRFSEEEMKTIDAAYRAESLVRCPLDEKPLLTTTWGDARRKMTYFVCRACGRIGAVAYDTTDPQAPGVIAQHSRASRPPSR